MQQSSLIEGSMVDKDRFDFEGSLKVVTRAMVSSSMHPSASQLLSYQAGELALADEERVRNHLAACSECARAVLDMETFPNVEAIDPSREFTAESVARNWVNLSHRLRKESHRPAAKPAPDNWVVSKVASLAKSLRFARAAAAIFLLATIGLAWATASLRRELRANQEPRLNLSIIELIALQESGERSQKLSGQTLEIGPASDGALVVLPLVELYNFRRYELVIKRPSDSKGRAIWRSSSLRRSPQGIFSFELPRGFLPAGRYAIEVLGWTGSERRVLATYLVKLQYQS